MRAPTVPSVLAIAALAITACSSGSAGPAAEPGQTGDVGGDQGRVIRDAGGGGGADGGGGGAGSGGATGVGFFPRLAPFADCPAFLDHIRAEANERVGPWGLGMTPGHAIAFEGRMELDDMDVAEDAAAVADDSPGPIPASDPGGDGDDGGSFTGTNVQEVGIDEADIVKTDGDRILVVSDNALHYIDLSSGEPVLTGQIALSDGWSHEIFFDGDRAFVLANGGSWGGPFPVEPMLDEVEPSPDDPAEAQIVAGDEPGFDGPAAIVTEIDLSDPSTLRVAGTMRVQGSYLSARAIGERVRLAVSSMPSELGWVYPQNDSGKQRATSANQQIIDESTLDDWLPNYSIETDAGARTGQLLACDRIHHPDEFAGFASVSVIDLDLSNGLPADLSPQAATGVLASGQTVYSSADRFYVATTEWADAGIGFDDVVASDDVETQIHAFSISPTEPTEYVASGSVDGALLNQFSLDEHEGFLRVLTTTGSPWEGPDQSATGLTVFEEQDDRLVRIGFVGGLGEGEQLHSARLMGDIGFAVTFRQIDPFYVLDLSDPRNPTVTGELKIPGVSTYLHPVGDDRVLGVGQDATDTGSLTGLKLSLFDVSDPAQPRETDVWTLPDANSVAEWDHRAFQMLGSTAIVPVVRWADGFEGAIVFDIADSITELGQVEHRLTDAEPQSDCRAVDAESLTPEQSELWWMVREGGVRVQICGPGDAGGWDGAHCERHSATDLALWFNDESVARTDLAAVGITADELVELCWPQHESGRQIVRSLVIDDTLWTVSDTAVQANSLDDLSLSARVRLR